jgi:hypothetical protein
LKISVEAHKDKQQHNKRRNFNELTTIPIKKLQLQEPTNLSGDEVKSSRGDLECALCVGRGTVHNTWGIVIN